MREFGLIGYPLGHSFSKKYFSEKFCKEGIEAGYELFAIPYLDRDTLYRLLAEKPDLVGFNVTVPYKEKIAALCDSLSEDAAAIGAVNTVRVSRHSGGEISLHGYNTDWQAFRDSVLPEESVRLLCSAQAVLLRLWFMLCNRFKSMLPPFQEEDAKGLSHIRI